MIDASEERREFNGWRSGLFKRLLDASAMFARLDSDLRSNVLPDRSPLQLEDLASQLESDLRNGDLDKAVQGLIDGSVHYSHSGYLNQQLNFPVPGAAVGALWAAILNQGQAVFEMAPLTSVIERRMLDWARDKLRLSRHSFGLSTGGGSLANLSALLAGRNKLDDWSTWDTGTGHPIRVLVSEHTHYSISRAASIVGIGARNVVSIETDERGRINQDALASALVPGTPTIVCLTFGTTTTGAFDDLGEFLARHDKSSRSAWWIHVDAAHGGSFYRLPELQRQFDALSQVDSVCWDFHKIFFQSVPLSFLFFKDSPAASFLTGHNSPYLSQQMVGRYPDMHNWTLECSRTANAMKLWVSLHTEGEERLAGDVKHLARRTRDLHDLLLSISALDVYCLPETNIICVRLRANSEPASNEATKRLVEFLNGRGIWSVGQVRMRDRLYLKLCLMNPRITSDGIQRLATEIRRFAAESAARELATDGGRIGTGQGIYSRGYAK
ncbi:aspartate aminotransferase family protein [Verminephrobacter aporrectodeae subsp. tuberculatae]|uniref:pyridoxal phosphate-dependent decarboxylase family protein n=1 Tax=Verminephrobacter aporrectodeae TaxID=1110389 RepID=UPI00023781E4|nr:pyridoxal-dependent decarboxylase [Verminephrobacter aporrectodeae]MCW5257148.1 aspartate aminotransferase family protein [Verminephrobacter aporrectodeae subsp. tuberculatae]MCW8163580.1 aspartate aminotransferase family protein [Verminephrobacter aporrectodeae subsp. tuberculatae]MCW8167699.1 aspartate aminotransferase family protein [Verminephrobacter aporrectodeae subsp. tuberculatae]